MTEHHTAIEYRILHPKPYVVTCSACPLRMERRGLKSAQAAADRHKEAAGQGVERGEG